MQSAPSVAYPVGRFSWQARSCLLGLCGLGLAGEIGMAILWPAERGVGLALLLGTAWAVWLVLSWRLCRFMPSGTLRWDASAPAGDRHDEAGSWWWEEEGRSPSALSAAIDRRLDWGTGMLLQGRVGGRTRWFWLDCKSAAGRWGELRRAVEAQANKA